MRPVPLEPAAWRFAAEQHRFEEHLGRPSLYLHTGDAFVAGAQLLDGTIEFDLAVTPERNFAGCTWRVLDAGNCESFYVRPHQSGNPDATQYTPVFNGVSGWQLYHGERYTVPLEIPFDDWLHVRVDVLGDVAEITAADTLLRVDGLKRDPVAGGIGLMDSNLAGAW